MSLEVLFQLIRNSTSALVLCKENGEIVMTSLKFRQLVSNKLPYESNIVDMLLHSDEINYDLLEIKKSGVFNTDILPLKIHLSENLHLKINLQSKIGEESSENYLLLSFREEDDVFEDNIIKRYVKSDNLFLNYIKPILVYNEKEEKILAMNNIARNIYENYVINIPGNLEVFNAHIRNLVSKARIGGLSARELELSINKNKVYLSFECIAVDSLREYYVVNFEDITLSKRKDEILLMEKKRLNNLVQFVPGVLFEFEIRDSALTFTYASAGIKEIIGLSAEHILKDSNILFSRFDRIDRARLHYLFVSGTAESRSVRNEYRIKDKEERPKWVTIDWYETSNQNGVIRGAGYLNDISEKKKVQKEHQDNERKKILIEYFSMVMLRNYSTPSMLEDLAKSIVKKLNLQDVIIYLYNQDNRMLEYGASYSEFIQGTALNHFPKAISCEKGVIGRCVMRQQSELINDLDEDNDYYFFDKKSGSEITVPIIFEGELLGVIDSEHVNKNAFNNYHLEVMEAISKNLGVRLVQKKIQKENDEHKATLESIYREGKIFNFEYRVAKGKLNNYCVDSLIDIIGISDKEEKIKIYEDHKLLFNYIADFDRISFYEFISMLNSRFANNSITIRIVSKDSHIKWLKVSVLKMKTNLNDVKIISGTIQDVSEFRNLEQRNINYEKLIESINQSQLELERNSDFKKSLSIVGNGLGISRAVISLFKEDEKSVLYVDDLVRWVSDKVKYQGKDVDYLKVFDNFNFYEGLSNRHFFDLEEFKFSSGQKEFLKENKIASLLGFPLRTPDGLLGVVLFIEEKEKRKWMDYEKTLLSAFSHYLALKYKNLSLVQKLSKNIDISPN